MRKESLLWMHLTLMLITYALAAAIVPSAHALATKVYVDPIEKVLDPPGSFTVDLNIADVAGLSAWEFKLGFDPEILDTDDLLVTEGPFLSDDGIYFTYFSVFVSADYAQVGCMMLGPETVSGSGTLATIEFEIIGTGRCDLHLYDSQLLDGDVNQIPHDTEDGLFYTLSPKAGFIYYTEAYPPPSPGLQPTFKPVVGETITFNATLISYDGKYSGSYDPDTMTDEDPGNIVSYDWDFDDGTTDSGVIVTHAYDAVGSYTVNLTLTDDDMNTDSKEATLNVVIRDLAITDVNVYPTVARLGQLVSIEITVLNEGSEAPPQAEFFNLTCYYDSTAIWYNETELKKSYSLPLESHPPTPLAPGEDMTITFTWNTTDVDEGTYTILANVSLVDVSAQFIPGEVDLADNEYYGPNVFLTSGAPVASFTLSPQRPRVDETVTFDASASNDTPPGWITAYTWDFGDGNVTTVENKTVGTYWIITHTYDTEDTYRVTLNVTDNEGLTGTYMKDVPVSVHDINVTSVSFSPATVKVGDSVSIYVTVRNEGGFSETFNVTAYRDGSVIETRTGVTLDSEEDTTLTFTWDTADVAPGAYTIKAVASEVPHETNATNNVKTASNQVTVTGHDIAVTDIDASPTSAKVGDSVSIYVTVRNEGGFSETFNVTAYRDSSVIETRTGVTLDSEEDTTLTFTWDTADVAPGAYTIKAVASEVPHETNATDNTRIYGTITIEKSSSTITVTAYPTSIKVGESTTINGSITPTRAGVNVTIRYRLSGEETWDTLPMATTTETSQYSVDWMPPAAGTYEIKASWDGDINTLADESDILTFKVEEAPPDTLLYIVAGIAIVIVAATIIVYIIKIRKPKRSEIAS